MKKPAYLLNPGDVVSSGETVISTNSVVRPGLRLGLSVKLKNPKTGFYRVAVWGYYSTICVKNVKPA